jgi:antitoxin component of RelBE/YafQ-DinJ toxin-antitoxin module
MAKTERLNVRTTEALKEKIIKTAISRGVTVSEIINDFIKSLPTPKN